LLSVISLSKEISNFHANGIHMFSRLENLFAMVN